jgi:hypothetical protein
MGAWWQVIGVHPGKRVHVHRTSLRRVARPIAQIGHALLRSGDRISMPARLLATIASVRPRERWELE